MTMNPHELNLFHETTKLRTYMMDNLTDADLGFRAQGNPSLGELCREMANVESAYLNSFRTFKMDWKIGRDDAPEAAASVDKLKARYKALDDEFVSVLEGIPDGDFQSKMVDRGGWSMPAGGQYHTYREALLIFCARCSVYLRMMGKPLNQQWKDWIG
jgi:hypothetical protein